MSEHKLGEIIYADGDITLHEGLRTVEVLVANTGDRAVQIGSHYHFFEANRALKFDREKAFGMHLDIPSGTAVRFEPGEEKKVTVVEYRGKQVAMGFNDLTNGAVNDPAIKKQAIAKARAMGFGFNKEG